MLHIELLEKWKHKCDLHIVKTKIDDYFQFEINYSSDSPYSLA